ncbi:MAG: hypothetical protein M1822_003382 [Bathelium mastoideum]|nr:MAG: hypothetical protein M1822_003382 [Bathelium mastoideum]
MELPFVLIIGLCIFYTAIAQELVPAQVQNDTFNDTYAQLNPAQVRTLSQAAHLSADIVDAVEVAIGFERSNWAESSSQLDPFYKVALNASQAEPGAVLKVEQYVNTTYYTLAPNVALSRFQFATKNLNGTVIPASGYVLWPWMPREFPAIKGFPAVGWGHGTSGVFGECGPSHIRNLWYQYSAPFTLALQGYVVVAPDYAGLGYLAAAAAGNDLIYAVQAAQKAWPQLSKEFVLMGHSEGGGAAWGAAQNLAEKPVPGYLGTIAGSPANHLSNMIRNGASPVLVDLLLTSASPGISSIFPSFKLSDWLTSAGVAAIEFMQAVQGCNSVATELLEGRGSETVRTDWQNSSYYFNAFDELTAIGGSIPFAGPMLVLQGLADDQVPPESVVATVNETCNSQPESQLQVAYLQGATHVPALFAGQRIWLNWIQERFTGVKVNKGCQRKTYSPALNVSAYQSQPEYFLEWPQYSYETA